MNGLLSVRAGILNGKTTLLDTRCEFPLQIQRPHRGPTSDALTLIVLSPSGGLLDGDELHAEITLERGASLDVRTQAATQLHAGWSSQSWTISLDEGTSFSSLPHSLAPHAGAIHHSKTSAVMAAGARLFLAEALTPGRAHQGELFAYQELRSDLDVWREGRLIARERQLLRPAEGHLPARLGPYRHFGSAYLMGGHMPDLDWAGYGVEAGLSELASAGDYCLRVLGQRAYEVEAALASAAHGWQAAAPGEGRDAPDIRPQMAKSAS